MPRRTPVRPFGLRLVWARCLAAILIVATLVGGTPPEPASAATAFGSSVFTANTTGNIVYTANTLMTCPASTACTDAQSNQGGTRRANNQFTMIDVDIDGDPSTFNSSASEFTLPAGASVLWAGLFWGSNSNSASRGDVLFDTPASASYLPLSAPATQLYNLGSPYQGWVDVTTQVQAGGTGTYTVANVQRTTGGGQYAGWSMVVVVEDPNEPFRNLSVFPGLQRVNQNTPIDVTVSGFLSPPVGPVSAEIGFIAYEGDDAYTGDYAELNGTRLGDALNPTTNFFNSRISDGAALPAGSSPNYFDQLGYDAKIVNTVGIVPPGATTATVQLRSTGDWYYPGVVTTAIDIFVPNLVLDLEKTVDDLNGGDVNPGDTLTYEISFTNQGEDAALNTVLTDAIPAGTTYVGGSAVITSGENPGTGNVIYNAPNDELEFYLGVGASAGTGGRVAPFTTTGTTYTVEFDVTVDAGTEGTDIDNTGTLNYIAETLGEAYSADTNTVTVPVEPLANLVFEGKSDSVDSVIAGESTVYDIRVSNDGPSPAENTTIVDTLPVGFVFDPATSSSSCAVTAGTSAAGQTVSCNIGTLASGANGGVSIGVVVDGSVAATTFTNNAEVTTTTPETTPKDNFGKEPTTVTRLVDLTVDKAFVPNPASAGGQITYTLTATNNGPSDAQNVSLVDGLPSGVAFSSVDDAACSHTSGTITCDYASLDAGQTVVVTIVVDVPASTPDGTIFTNRTKIWSDDPEDPAGDPNDDSTNTPVGRAADLEITKTSTGPFVAGTTVLFELVVVNNGPSDATDVVVTDDLPVGTTFNAGLSSSGCTFTSGTVTCGVAALPPAGSATFTIAVDLPETLADGTALTNEASVDANELDPTPANNDDDLDFTVVREADLAIVKSVSPGNVAAGSNLTYTIDVTNNGPSQATGTTVTDVLPPGVTLVSAPGCTGSTTLTCVVGSLASGATAQLTITVAVPGGTPDGTDLVNNAAVSGNESDPASANDSSQATATVDRTTSLEITKAESSGIADPALAGTSMSWDLVVSNLGTPDDTNVVITDDLSTFPLSNIAATITGTGNTCSVAAGVVSCSVPTLLGTASAPANSITVTITADLDADIPDGTVLVNTATANGDFSSEAEAVEETTINRRADLNLDKAGPSEIIAGTAATWTVTVTNTGPGQADNVEITDILPPSAIYQSHNVTSGSATCTTSSPVVCDAGNLAPGAVVSIEFVAEIADTDPDGSSVANTAFVVSDTIDPDPSNNEDTVDSDVVRSADLEITKTTLDSPVTAGESVRFTVTVTNTGPSVASGVVVSDPIPAGMTFDPAASDSSCVVVGVNVECSLGSLDPDDPPVDLVLAFVVDPGQPVGTITNLASVDANEDDPDASNDSASDDVTIETEADVAITKSSSATPVVPGEPYEWDLAVTNNGPSDAVNTIVTDTLPAGVTFDPATSDTRCAVTAGTPATGQTITCNLATLAPSQTVNLTIGANIDPALTATPMVNAADVDSDTTDPTPGNNDTSDSSPVEPEADLSVTKTGAATVAAGNSITWNVAITNDGPSDADNTIVTDTLPAGVTFDPTTSTPGCAVTAGTPATGQTITCNLATLTPSQTVNLTIAGATDPELTDGSSLTNSASAESDTTDPDASNNDDDHDTAVERVVAVAVTKSASPTAIAAGGQVIYTLSLTNNGPSSASLPMLADPLAPGLSLESFSLLTAGSCSGAVTCSIAELAPGDSITVELIVNVDPGAPAGTITNTATGSAPGDPDGDSASEDITVSRSADLAVTKSADPTSVDAGEQVTFTIVVDNLGPSEATGVELIDPIPAGMVYVPGASDPACAQVGSDIVCSLGDLLPGDPALSIELVFDVTSSVEAGTLTNTATASANEPDPDSTNDSGSADVEVDNEADLAVTKTSPAADPVPGEPYEWDLAVTNNGPSDADNTIVTDTLPAGVTFDPTTSTPGCAVTAGTPATGQTITCNLATLTPSQTVNLTIGADIDPARTGTLANSADVASDATDSTPGNDTDSDSRVLVPEADLALTKTGPASATAGESASWTLAVSNNGPSDAVNTIVTDTLPAGVTFDAASSSAGCSVTAGTPTTGQTITCNLATLTPSQTVNLTISADIDPARTGTLSNTATVDSDTTDSTPDNNDDDHDTAVDRTAALAVTKVADTDAVTAGGQVTYTLTLTNNGPSSATGPTLADPLATGLTLDSFNLLTPGSCTGAITCTVPSLAPGASLIVEVVADIDPTLPDPTTITNTATGSAPEDADGATASEDITVTRSADLATTKTSSAPILNAGEQVTFTITLDNLGASQATNVVITDPVPGGLAFVAASSDTRCSLVGANVECDLGTVNPSDAIISLALVFDIDASQPAGTITNTASANGDEDDPDASNDSGADDIDIETEADLALTKSSTADPVIPGEPYEWDLSVINNGPSDAANSIVTDTLPIGAAFDPATSDTRCAVTAGTPAAGQTITCNLGVLAPSQVVNLTIGANIDPALTATPMVNAADVDSDTTDPTPGNNDAVDSSPVEPEADLELDKVAPPAMSAGTATAWTLTVTNIGPSDAVNTIVTDTLPAGVTFDPATSTPGCAVTAGTPATGQTITCNLATLTPSQTVNLTIGADIDPTRTGTLSNTAEVASDTTDSTTDNNDDTTSTAVDRVADLTISKTADPAVVTAGGQVTYTVEVINNGPATATNVSIVDPMAPQLSATSATPLGAGNCGINTGTVTCDVATLASGASASFEIVADVDSSVASGATITNTVTADSDETDPDGASASEDAPVLRSADLDFAKTLTTATPTAGEPVSFDLVVTNNGPSDATNVVVTDPLPAGTTFDDLTSSPLCDLIGGDVVCTVTNLADGASVTIPLVLMIDSNVADNSSFTNSASVSGNEPDPDPDNNGDDAQVDVDRLVDLSTDKIAPATTPVPGAATSWAINVANAGPSDASNVIVTDDLPTGVTFDPATSDSRCSVTAGVPATGQTVTCLLPVLTDGGTDSFVIGVDIDADRTGTITNTASTTSDEDDSDPSNNADSESSVIEPSADLQVTKTAVTDPIVAGEPVEYTISVTNNGPSDATGVTVTDAFPSVLTFDDPSSDVRCDLVGPDVVCGLGTIAASGSTSITLFFDLDESAIAGATITNTATASSDVPDPDSSNDTDNDESPITRATDLWVNKTGPATMTAGGTGQYTITAGNDGPSDATGVVFGDAVPAGLTITGISGPAFCSFTGSSATCAAGTVTPGTSFTLTVDVAVDSGVADLATLTNSASISGNETDPDPSNDSGAVDSTINRSADLQTSKTVLTDPVVPGEPALFEITVTNNGPSDAANVTVDDPLAPGLTFLPSFSSIDCVAGVTCSVDSLPAGASVTFTVGVDVDTSLGDGTTVANTATASADEADPDGSNDAGSDSAPVSRQTDLSIIKSGPATPTTAGTQLTWTLDVGNDGPSDASNVIITDSLPVGATFNTAGSDSRCSVVAGVIECPVGTMINGATDQLVILVDLASTLGDGQLLTNSASIAGDENDPIPDNNSSDHTADIERTTGLSLTKIDVIDPVIAGETIAWDLTAENLGPSASDNVVITDTLPVGVTFDPAASDLSCALTAGTPAIGQTITCTLGTLDDGESATVRIEGALDQALLDGQQFLNIAVARGDNATDGFAQEETTINRTAELVVDKVTETSPIIPGVPVIYTVTVTNNGPSQATDVEMTDLLPAGSTIVNVTGPVTCVETTGTVTCPIGTLNNGEDAEFTIEVLPASYLVTGDDFVNQAVVSGNEDADGDTTNSSEPIARTVDLGIEKTASANSVAAGNGMTFELLVSNGGPSDAAAVVVTDTLPAGMTFNQATSSADCSAIGQIVTCTTPVIVADAQLSFVIGVLIDSTVTGDLTNNASVSSNEPNTNPDPTDDATVEVGEEADLELTKVGPTSVVAGEDITYTLTVTNAGPSIARDVTITDTLPAELAVATLPTECSAVGTPETITCLVGDLPAGATVEIELIVVLDPSATGTVRNVASVTSNATDLAPDNDVATTQADIERSADLNLVKTLASTDIVAGGPAEWIITITNNGPSTATNVVVTDELAEELTFIAEASSSTCSANTTQVVTCAIAQLAVGESADLTVMTTVDSGAIGTVENTATARADEADQDGAVAEAAGEVRRSNANIEIKKKVTESNLTTNGLTTWVIDVTNSGPENVITPLTISDALPAELAYSSHTITGTSSCQVNGQLITCSIADGLAVGTVVTLELVTRTVATTEKVENTAKVAANGLAGSPDGIVEVAAAAVAQRPASSGPLAFTGSSTGTVVSISLLLMLLGGGAVVLSRRQRRPVRVTSAKSDR